MSDPALNSNRFVPNAKVFVDGKEVSTEIDLDILEVIVHDYANGPSFFCVHLNDWDSYVQEFKYIDGPLFKEGTKIEIKFGYEDEIISIIKGDVTALEPEFHQEQVPTLKVQGYDALHRFRRGRKTKSYLEMKDSDIASQVASDLSLTANVEDTNIVHDYILQNNQTDIDFLMERARRIRFELVIEDGKFFFRPASNDKSEVVSIRYGQSLLSFYPRLNTLTQVSEVEVKGWDVMNKKGITGKAASGDEISKMKGKETGPDITESSFFKSKKLINDIPVFSEGEANQIAKGRFNMMITSFIEGEGTCIGNANIRAGDVIELTHLGKRFSGLYYIKTAIHQFNEEGYLTQFTVERNAT